MIDELCRERLGREPDLENPKGFNDIIQWLKLYDQRKEHITACDKWAVRSMVRKKADCLVPAKLGISLKWLPAVMKCTHDCGSVQVIEGLAELKEAQASLKERLARPYGIDKGEWAYQFGKPRIVTEKRLEANITDYKFHCSHGQIRWCQVIADRASGETKETILDPAGKVLPLHMDQNMQHVPDDAAFPGTEAWQELTGLARRLADGWRYVRVDLYWSRKRAWFGETTFWPLSGCYLTQDEPIFGEMLKLDLSYKFKPIVE